MGIASSDTRRRALEAYRAEKGTQEEIASLFGISTRTFQRWCRQFDSDGSTTPGERGHRPAVYSDKKLERLDKLVAKRPDATLEELREATGESCSLMSVQRAVARLGYGLKKNGIGQRTKPA